MSLRISIAMATYNGAKYLQEQLDSFVYQTRQPDELIITDDGSTDTTQKIIENFAKTSPFEVRYFRNDKNLGYAGNFNAALMQTTGDLVFMSDQDDVWFPEKIANIEDLAVRHSDKLVFMNDAALTDGELNEVGLTKLGQIRSAGVGYSSFVMGCCCAVRRDLLDLCLPILQGYTSHDAWIVNFADALDAKMIHDCVLQLYRRHGNNESNFLVNSTRRVTKWDVYKSLIMKSRSHLNMKRSEERLQQLEIYIQGAVRALERSSPKYSKQLESMISDKKLELMHEGIRNDIRSKPLFPRLISVIKYSSDGGYRRVSGFKSAMRDLMG